ncbi:LEAF RUST 10 DISEASE-RESISTANCE LOCUS RECEPTOR-LIKE PROTEIN KINASE-like 1.1 [Eucalyptus grandis]|uniref:LEAF RUST 10 DISEASE-RESISTANCE LOCUS RECEPTOR-LIKE PROTEIN KINASE-like 1.1 n=1 Tax=Eucalyptus grandis TaxID=71139 RepID=UPI00192ED32C|nr:LEAF RUST 10 DISEASE-RESISTANCE LOCUS RECEPTOR-LIKE PROTEIN KINASE-like 1.1 [Eucalyptus grandis]
MGNRSIISWCIRYWNRKLGHHLLVLHDPLEDDEFFFELPFEKRRLISSSSVQFFRHGSEQCPGKLWDGQEVAVKRLYERNYRRVKQFMNEVDILTSLQHKNLVSLYGCTSRHSRELLLVYEYISNGTVANHIHGQRANSSTTLPWQIRMGIAIETATALAYLHASDIVYRDVKTNNILFDKNFEVKVTHFGLSRLLPNDVSYFSRAPQGTPGYVDPKYRWCYQLTEKSDVYSFGVVLIELVSSKPAVDLSRERDEINLADFAINKIQKCNFGQGNDASNGGRDLLLVTCAGGMEVGACVLALGDEVFEELKAIGCNENAAYKFVNADESESVLAPSSPNYDNSQLPKNMQLTILQFL